MELPNSKITSLLIFVVSLSLISLMVPDDVLGFEDYFNGTELDNNKWQSYENGGTINVVGGFVTLSSNASTFPYIYAKQNPFPETGDFSLKIKMQYPSLTSWGDGVVIGNLLPPNNTSQEYLLSDDNKKIVLFQIWQDSHKHFRAYYRSCININECNEEITIVFQFGEDNRELNEFQIIYSESQYKFLFNGALIFTSTETTRRPTTLWMGNPITPGGSNPWSSLTIDYIDISSIPTSTPIPSLPPNPIVLLPGLGASWNHEAMILNQPVSQTDWYMAPFVKAYDGLIQTFKNAGYEDAGSNRNLFVFNYDWRQPIETTANQLKDFIQNTIGPPTGIKIDFVGHSLGGMVARTYVQNNPDHQVDQLITIGSPNKGVPKVYYLWEGAELKKGLNPWQRIAAGILLHLNKRDYQNNVETIRSIVPGLKDLLPTFSYLKLNGVEQPISEMKQRNIWLETLNQLPLPDTLISILNTIIGIKENSTLRWINIEEQNQFDRILGKWEDGRPIGEEFDTGDDTVLVESGQLEGVNVIKLLGLNHGDLVETVTSQQAIINLLGLSPSEIAIPTAVIYKPSLIFQLASPVSMTIYGPDGDIIADSEKLVFIPNAEEGNYHVQVIPENPGGTYRLLIGEITEEGNNWREFSGEVTTETDEYDISFTTNSQQTKLELLELAKEQLIAAHQLTEALPKPLSILLGKAIEKRIKEIEEIITLLGQGRVNQSQTKIRQAIFSLSILEKNLGIWERIFGKQTGIKTSLREAKDYLLQIYEF